MRITIVIGQMRLGGTERVVSILCQQMIERGDEVVLINLSHKRTNFYNLHPAVQQISLDLENTASNRIETLRNVTRRIQYVRRSIQEVNADIVISFTDKINIITLFANAGLKYPHIISVRAHPTLNRILLRIATWLMYPTASSIVSVSRGVDLWYKYIKSSKRFVIGNPVQEDFLNQVPTTITEYSQFRIVSLGRLGAEKNHALLIRAFAKVAHQFPQWHVYIYGDGEEYTTLQTLIESLDLAKQVVLHQPVTDVMPVLLNASIYVQPSNSEGFPNAVLEAMACNLPVIVTDYLGDPRDFLTHEETGLIVPLNNIDAMADALTDLITNPEKRERLGQTAGYVREAFSTQGIIEQWYDVIKSVIKER